jgi:hypothetical protein
LKIIDDSKALHFDGLGYLYDLQFCATSVIKMAPGTCSMEERGSAGAIVLCWLLYLSCCVMLLLQAVEGRGGRQQASAVLSTLRTERVADFRFLVVTTTSDFCS